MKQRTLFVFSLMIALVAFVSSCDTTPPTPVGPSLVVTVTDVDTVFTDSIFVITVSASKGDADLTRIEVQESGTAIAPARLAIDGFSAGSNPSPLNADAAASFTYELTITAGSNDLETSTYTIIVTDAGGETASESFEVTTVTPVVETPVTERTMILLLNQGGPAGQGGLDLESGNGTGTQAAGDSIADIRDMGIDTNLPVASNWRQKIGVINSSDLRYPAAGLVYEDVATVEALAAAFEAGQSFTESDKVEIGDVFLAKSRRGNIYLLKTVNITVTPSNNQDSYEFSVKN